VFSACVRLQVTTFEMLRHLKLVVNQLTELPESIGLLTYLVNLEVWISSTAH
jgi:hypothetical protein